MKALFPAFPALAWIVLAGLSCAACSRQAEPKPPVLSQAQAPDGEHPPQADPLLTYENFSALKAGMNEDRVRELLGKPSAIEAQEVKGTDRRVIYTYRDALSSITVNFSNGALSSKSCNLQDKPPSAKP